MTTRFPPAGCLPLLPPPVTDTTTPLPSFVALLWHASVPRCMDATQAAPPRRPDLLYSRLVALAFSLLHLSTHAPASRGSAAGYHGPTPPPTYSATSSVAMRSTFLVLGSLYHHTTHFRHCLPPPCYGSHTQLLPRVPATPPAHRRLAWFVPFCHTGSPWIWFSRPAPPHPHCYLTTPPACYLPNACLFVLPAGYCLPTVPAWLHHRAARPHTCRAPFFTCVHRYVLRFSASPPSAYPLRAWKNCLLRAHVCCSHAYARTHFTAPTLTPHCSHPTLYGGSRLLPSTLAGGDVCARRVSPARPTSLSASCCRRVRGAGSSLCVRWRRAPGRLYYCTAGLSWRAGRSCAVPFSKRGRCLNAGCGGVAASLCGFILLPPTRCALPSAAHLHPTPPYTRRRTYHTTARARKRRGGWATRCTWFRAWTLRLRRCAAFAACDDNALLRCDTPTFATAVLRHTFLCTPFLLRALRTHAAYPPPPPHPHLPHTFPTAHTRCSAWCLLCHTHGARPALTRDPCAALRSFEPGTY